MEFSKENRVIHLCAKGMQHEGHGKPEDASRLFWEAWNIAATAFEKFTAAHYVARHQKNISDKLAWDKAALKYAMQTGDESIKSTLPSLFLNIGKCYEDPGDFEKARRNYETAFSLINFLPDDGYGRMIKAGIDSGLKRLKSSLHRKT